MWVADFVVRYLVYYGVTWEAGFVEDGETGEVYRAWTKTSELNDQLFVSSDTPIGRPSRGDSDV